MEWKTLKKGVGYKSKWTTLRRDEVINPKGEEGIYDFVDSQPSVMVVPLTKNGEIYLVKVFRYPTQEYSWELPGGRTDGADIKKTAINELREETGLIAEECNKIGSFYPLNGLSNELCHVFLATDLTQTNKDSMKEDAISEKRAFKQNEVYEMIINGVITDGQSISSLLLARLHLHPRT